MLLEQTAVLDYDELAQHVGHNITVAPVFDGGGEDEHVAGASLDCHTCGETIATTEKAS